MRNLTATLQTTVATSATTLTSPWAGFKVTLTRTSTGGHVTPPVQQEVVFSFGGLTEGDSYTLDAFSVDANGAPIQTLATISFTVPPSAVDQTYQHIDGVTLAWS